MTENLNIALQLLLVGMVTVFFILTIVVGLGKLLITLVNKYAATTTVAVSKRQPKAAEFSKQKLAVLSAVVETVTQGQGVIKSVKKIK